MVKRKFYCDCSDTSEYELIKNIGMDTTHKYKYQCPKCKRILYVIEDYEDEIIKEQKSNYEV